MAIDPDRQLPRGSGTFNEELFDALVRHQIGLLNLSGSIRNRIFRILDATEADLANQIRRRLRGATPATLGTRRLQLLLESIRKTRLTAWNQVTAEWVNEMLELSIAEAATATGIVRTVSPVVLNLALPAPELLRAIVTTRPFQGRTMREWARSVRNSDLSRIEDQIKIGIVQGESSQAIARRVVGTVRQRGRNGVTEITRRDAAAITRTAVNAVSNTARRELFKANADLFDEELYVATLDARTTPICRSLDGDVFPVGEGPIPPLHFNCRSLRVAILDGQVIGARPVRNFTQQGLVREYARREGLGNIRSRKDLPRGHKGAFDKFSRTRIRELTGTVPAKVTYGQWLGRQPAQFQNDVLGVTRARLFRRGDVTLDRFVDRSGQQIPLSELAKRDADAFRQAGLDPEDFL